MFKSHCDLFRFKIFFGKFGCQSALLHFPPADDDRGSSDDKTCPSMTDSLIAENLKITMHDSKLNSQIMDFNLLIKSV